MWLGIGTAVIEAGAPDAEDAETEAMTRQTRHLTVTSAAVRSEAFVIRSAARSSLILCSVNASSTRASYSAVSATTTASTSNPFSAATSAIV